MPVPVCACAHTPPGHRTWGKDDSNSVLCATVMSACLKTHRSFCPFNKFICGVHPAHLNGKLAVSTLQLCANCTLNILMRAAHVLPAPLPGGEGGCSMNAAHIQCPSANAGTFHQQQLRKLCTRSLCVWLRSALG